MVYWLRRGSFLVLSDIFTNLKADFTPKIPDIWDNTSEMTPGSFLLLAWSLLQRTHLAMKCLAQYWEYNVAKAPKYSLKLHTYFGDSRHKSLSCLRATRLAIFSLGLRTLDEAAKEELKTEKDFMPHGIIEPKSLEVAQKRDWIIFRDTKSVFEFIHSVSSIYLNRKKHVLDELVKAEVDQ